MSYSYPSADFVTTSLSGVLAAGATSATIGTGLNLPATNGILTASYDTANAIGVTDGPETFSYTSYTSGTGALAGLTRGLAGTTDVQHSSGQSVQSVLSSLNFGNRTLGYAQITTDFTSTATPDYTDVTSLSATVTIPAGGARIRISVFGPQFTSSATAGTFVNVGIFEGSTELTNNNYRTSTASYGIPCVVTYISPTATVTAGSHTYKVAMKQSAAGTMTLGASATSPAFILVENIT